MFQVKPPSRIRLACAAVLLLGVSSLGIVPWRIVAAQPAAGADNELAREAAAAESRRTFYKSQAVQAQEVSDTIQAVLALGGMVRIAPRTETPQGPPNEAAAGSISDDTLWPKDNITPEQSLVIGVTHKVTGIQLAGLAERDVDLDVLEHAPPLETMTLQKAKISEKGLARLGRMEHLWYLNARNNTFEKSGLEHVKKLSSLRVLDLMGADLSDDDLQVLSELKLDSLTPPNGTSDAGMAHISGIKSLKFLALSGTKVTDKSIDYLKKLDRLEVVSLRRTAVTPQAVESLKKAKPDLHAYP